MDQGKDRILRFEHRVEEIGTLRQTIERWKTEGTNRTFKSYIMTKDQIMIIEEWFHAKSIENIFNKTLTENFPKSQIQIQIQV